MHYDMEISPRQNIHCDRFDEKITLNFLFQIERIIVMIEIICFLGLISMSQWLHFSRQKALMKHNVNQDCANVQHGMCEEPQF